MPIETSEAVKWSLNQTDDKGDLIKKGNAHLLVDKVREYFNTNNIQYETFSYEDLKPYL